MRNSRPLAEIALAFVGRGDFDARMNAALAKMGEFLEVSRVYVVRDSADRSSASNTYEWCAEGISPHKENLQDIPYSAIPSWKRLLAADGRIVSTDIGTLPQDLIAVLQPQGVKSILVYPLYSGDSPSGFIGFDECSRNRAWGEGELDILKTASGIVSAACERELAQDRLRASEENFRRFFDTVDDLIVIGDKNGAILFTNDAVRRKLGFTAEELRGMAIRDLHPEQKRRTADEILGSMLRKERDSCPLELRKKAGGELPVETRIWFGEWDGAECIFGVSKDLSAEQEALQKFTKLFESNPALMAITEMESGRFSDVNSAFLRKLGYDRRDVIGKTSAELGLFVNPAQQRRVREELVSTRRVSDAELEIRRKDGVILDGLFSGELIDNQGKSYFLTVMVDISEQVDLRRRLERQGRRLGNIIDGARLGTWEWNVQTGQTVFNERWAEIVGYSLSELAPVSISTWESLAHPEDLAESGRLLEAHFAGETDFYSFEGRMKHKSGRWVWVLDRGQVVERDQAGNPLWMFGTHVDITELKELEERIRQISIRDPLTDIYNRRFVFERLREIEAEYSRRGRNFCVTILDLDYFKLVNDLHGHQAGDFVLKEFAAIVASSVRPYDIVGRYGGEEFVVVSIDSTAREAACAMRRIIEAVRGRAYVFEGAEIRITVSGGMADSSEFAREGSCAERIVAAADRRLYAAKEAGRDMLVGPDDASAFSP